MYVHPSSSKLREGVQIYGLFLHLIHIDAELDIVWMIKPVHLRFTVISGFLLILFDNLQSRRVVKLTYLANEENRSQIF